MSNRIRVTIKELANKAKAGKNRSESGRPGSNQFACGGTDAACPAPANAKFGGAKVHGTPKGANECYKRRLRDSTGE